MKKSVFRDFAEYWFYAKQLAQKQRDVVFSNLSNDQQKSLEKDYKKGGWEDLIIRNEIDVILEDIKKTLNIDVLELRCKALSGKTIYVKKSQWDYIIDTFSQFDTKHSRYVIGGIEAQPTNNEDTVLVIKKEITIG